MCTQSLIDKNRSLQVAVEKNIAIYNEAVSGINQCLEALDLSRKNLPIISESDLLIPIVISDVIDAESFVIDEASDSEV